ncbi:ATP-binding cassette domain-containing protein [Candidatus Bipolaricaulota bacterium]|nr:ATP-binding cassette domain-containing protein [Candidatus Bipolaricaulota bacterium]MCF7890253.1 ATP-binding cassette domain-containing protein [Candidatus Bipolaricaulota bacterium]
MNDTLLEVRGLGKRYAGFPALNGVDFSLRSGQVKGVMGPNGAGKSTLLKLIAGEIRASSGSVFFAGHPVTNLPVDRISNRGVSYMPQRPSCFPSLTVEENVRGAAQTSLFLSRAEDESIVRALLELVGLRERAGTTAVELPFGDKRLLDVAMALAGKPRLLLADEPTAGVDRDASEKILELLRKMSSPDSRGEFGLDGLIFTEHDREILLDFPDEVGFLRAGELIVEGSPERVKHEGVVQNYLADHRHFDDRKEDLV